MCQPKVFKSRENDTWRWNCIEHRKLVENYRCQMQAFSAAELHKIYHDGSITKSQFLETSIIKVSLQGAPRLTHLYDQFLAEVRAQSERDIDAIKLIESETEYPEEGCSPMGR